MKSLYAILVCILAVALLAADKPDDKQVRLEKARAGLRSADVEVRRKTLGSLNHSDISDPLIPEMLKLLDDRDGEVRSMAATAVGTHGKAALAGVPALIAQLKRDTHKEARETAARALGRIGKAVKANRDAVKPLRVAADKDADPVTRAVALGALGMMGEDVPGQDAALRKYLHHDEPLVRMKACHALGMLGTAAKAAAPDIIEVLGREKDPHQRGYIARSLGSTGDPKSLPALYEALKKETDEGAKGEMRGAIAALGGKPPK